MKYLVLSPPVHQPSEPPAGAFLLTGALKARGVEAAFLDLSLEFFHYALERSGINTSAAVRYMKAPPGGRYDGHGHASHSGVIMSALKRYAGSFPGWSLTPMDCSPPMGLHRPMDMPVEGTPFSPFLRERLEPVLDDFPSAEVLVSVAYLSQLPAALELGRFLQRRGRKTLFGGSLFESLSRTGTGLELLQRVIPGISTGDGSDLFPEKAEEPVLARLECPQVLSGRSYLSPAEVLPLAFTSGCIWNRCLFCPDREKPLVTVPVETVRGMIGKAPHGAMIHFIDSAMPVDALEKILPSLREKGTGFFGFARAGREFEGTGLLSKLSEAGCSMLQWGLESGSHRVLRRFRKGTDPETGARVLEESRKAGIRNYVYLLFGLPGETDRDRNATLELVRAAKDDISFLNVSVFNLPVSSELTARHREFGIDLDTYDPGRDVIRLYRPFTQGSENPRDKARAFIRNTFSRDPAVAELLSATPRWFKASHMAFMKSLTADEAP